MKVKANVKVKRKVKMKAKVQGKAKAKVKVKVKATAKVNVKAKVIKLNVLGKLDLGPTKVNFRAHFEVNIDASHLNHLKGKLRKLRFLLSLTTGRVTLHS